MILQVDIGNTFLKWRVLGSGGVFDRGEELSSSVISMKGVVCWDKITSVLVSNVASADVERRLRYIIGERLPGVIPFFAETQVLSAGVTCAYKEPSLLGVDRWLAVVAGYAKFKQSCFVVDCGSAITVDVVDSSGLHKGGYILPGLSLMRKSLSSGTERVVFDRVRDIGLKYGETTSECVQSGIDFVIVSVLEGLRAKMGPQNINRLIVTGGDASYIASFCPFVECEPDLVLDGLSILSKECGEMP